MFSAWKEREIMRIDLDKCAKKISINNHEELSNLNL